MAQSTAGETGLGHRTPGNRPPWSYTGQKRERVCPRATSGLSPRSGRTTVKGMAGAELEGATVKVTGQGGAELTAAGPVTVRGSLVRIN